MSSRRPGLRRTIQVVVIALVAYWIILPLVPQFFDAAHDLNRIEPNLLLAGFGLQMISLFFYSMLTKAALGGDGDDVSLLRLFRIQLSTKALGNVMPGGSAASTALGYRLLTMSGVKGPDTAFALATAGIGSAVVLNIILWIGLIVSIPTSGVSPIYTTAAIVGVILMAFAGFIVFGLVEGQGRAERVVRSVARRFGQDEQHAAEVLAHLGTRIEGLWQDRTMLTKVIAYATANWLVDAASLWVFLRAFGESLNPVSLLVAFGLANVLSVIPITPGGLGIVEGVYIPSLIGFGMASSTAAIGVLSYRVAQYWLPIFIGWFSYLTLRIGRFSIDRSHRLAGLKKVAEAEAKRGLTTADWVERYAPRDRTGQFEMPRFNPGDLEYNDDTGGQDRPE